MWGAESKPGDKAEPIHWEKNELSSGAPKPRNELVDIRDFEFKETVTAAPEPASDQTGTSVTTNTTATTVETAISNPEHSGGSKAEDGSQSSIGSDASLAEDDP